MRKVAFAVFLMACIIPNAQAQQGQPAGRPAPGSSAPMPSVPQPSQPAGLPSVPAQTPAPSASEAQPTSTVPPPAATQPQPAAQNPPANNSTPAAATPQPNAGAKPPVKPVIDPENTLVLELKDGKALIALRPDIAPKNVARIKELTRQNFYNGLVFHRVIPAFIAQGGDPKGDGSGGTGVSLEAEFSNETHVRGTVSMARKPDDVNSADSQFFIVIGEAASQLDNQYTVIGKVVEGMDYVMRIRKGSRALNGSVHNPDKIIKMTILADDQKAGTAKK